MPKRILIMKPRAIGDVVLATAVLPSLRSAYPGAEIDFLTERPSAPVIEGNPFVNHLWILPRKGEEGLLRESLGLISRLRAQRYDLVIDLFGNPRTALLTRLSGAKTRVGYRFRMRTYAYTVRVEPRGDRVHELFFNLDALEALKVPIRDAVPFFPIPEAASARMDRWLEEVGLTNRLRIGFHPWGGWPAKRWPLGRFAALGKRLVRRHGAVILVFWGPGERPYAEQVANMGGEGVWLIPPTTLKEVAALLKRCHLVVANDSGPMHIAAAVGTPTIGLFGPTDPRLQGPYGSIHAVVTKAGLSCLGCNRLTCPDGRCMTELSVDEVTVVVEAMLRRMHGTVVLSKR